MRIETTSEAGFSLAETIVTVAIVGITFTALLGGMITSITVSSAHRSSATADSLARSAAEWVKDGVRTPYVACAGAGAYALGGVTVPSGYTVSITQVEYWNGALPGAGAYSPAFVGQGTCQGSGDKGLQRITIAASAPDGSNETVQVIKRVAA